MLTPLCKGSLLMKRTILYHLKNREKAIGKKSGFTLVELMLVMGIFATLLTIAFASFETLVYGSTANRALVELVGVLQDARLKAIKTSQPVTVTFNLPAANQLQIAWTENGVNQLLVHRLTSDPARVSFDPAPPGGAPAPDASFLFTNLGFIQPAGANTTSNIYIVDNDNGRRFHIAATLGGGIIERQWDGAAWNGPVLSDGAAPGP
jgi:prepilin-type N-terminal cleavage/methylation domain-containing protein